MAWESLKATADRLVAHCRAGTTQQGLTDLYHPDCVSTEAASMRGEDPVSRGVAAIRAKHAWWDGAVELRSSETTGPFLHGADRFAVIFDFDGTERDGGRHIQMKEVGVYTIGPDGRIVSEDFYYAA
jgi:hypothetical protein